MMRLGRARGPLSSVVLLGALAIIPLVMGCAGYAEPRGFLSVTPSSVFITTAVGTSNSQTVSVSNNSHATINVTQAQVTGAGFSAQKLSLPTTIAPGQSLNITVKFTPTSSKSVDGILMLMTDGQFRPVMAHLHGSTGSSSGTGSPSSPAVSSVAVSPAIASTTTGGKVQFTSTVDGTTTDKDVTWTATSGSVSSAGAFTAASSAGTSYVTATSVADPTKKSTAAVTVSTATKPTSPDPTPTVSSVAVSPASTSTKTGTSVQFTANVQGTVTDKSVTWKAVLGSISGSGVYTAPTKTGTDTVTATSHADPTMSAKSTVSISAATAAPTVSSVSVSPASASSTTSGTLQFSAGVQGTVTDKSVTWHASLGTINASGAYTAPSKAGTDTVTATSNADSSKTATASVSVTAPSAQTVTSVSVSPASTSATTGGTLQFSASVQGTATNKAVTWRASLGSINSSGAYTAPSKAGTDTVVATSSFDSSKSASASVSVTAPAAPSQPSQPSANTVSLSTFGNVGFGGDDTSVFQTALNSTASNAEVLEIPAGSYNVSPLNIPSNANIKVDSGVTVSANSGYGSSDRMLNINSKNVTITGAGATTSVFQMPKARSASQGDGSQYRHCLGIQNASNVTITGIGCNQSGGDGIYISAASSVTVSNCVFDQNFRDGGSFIGQLSNVNITNNTFSNTNGSAPQAGVDIEPNVPSDFISGLNLTDNTMKGNTGDGLAISLWTLTSASQAVSITVTRNHSDSNGRYGYYLNNNDPSNASGTITLNDCTTDSSASDGANARFYAANGASATFNNLTVTNPHRNGPDPSYGDSAAVAIIRGGGGTVAEGNVHYVNTNIQATNGELEYYFEFQDNSNVGVSNVTFTPGTLSGAKASVNGLLNGQTTNSVN